MNRKPSRLDATVEVSEEVYRREPADNGAGPMWCSGSGTLARIGAQVFCSGLETISGARPLNNCRWLLFRRGPDGWRLACRDEKERTREPCPLVGFPDGRLLLSANPARTPLDQYRGPAEPQVLEFDVGTSLSQFRTILPEWRDAPEFNEHSYRTFTCDGRNREWLLAQNLGYDKAYWRFRDAAGEFAATGVWQWPVETKRYPAPTPLRLCYPNVTLKDRGVHFLGASDIAEPDPDWADHIKKQTGAAACWVFRRLFYACTPDICAEPLGEWIELANRDETAGHIRNCDLYVAPDRGVHVLWLECNANPDLRDRFFPKLRLTLSLQYAVLRRGKKVRACALISFAEGDPGMAPRWARFHVAADGRILVVAAVGKGSAVFPRHNNAGAFRETRNVFMEVMPDGAITEPVALALDEPFRNFFTAGPRVGSEPSNVLDLLGMTDSQSNAIRYARIRFHEKDE